MSAHNPAEHDTGVSSTSLGEIGAEFQTGDEHGYMGSNEPLPAGWYQAMITHTEIKPTKDMTGKRLNLTWEVIDGAHKGRKVFSGLNIVNKNAKAEEISRKELNTICAASGFAKGHVLRDTTELHNAPIWIQLKVTPGNAQYEPKNEVNGYHPYTERDPATGGPIRAKPQAAPAAAATPGPGTAAQTRAAAAAAHSPTQAANTARPATPSQVAGVGGVPW